MSTKAKRAKYANKGKVFVELYNKICTAVSLLADLLDIERLTDTIVLKVLHMLICDESKCVNGQMFSYVISLSHHVVHTFFTEIK